MVTFVLTTAQRQVAIFAIALLLVGFGFNFVVRIIYKIRIRRQTRKKFEQWAKEHGFGNPGNGRK